MAMMQMTDVGVKIAESPRAPGADKSSRESIKIKASDHRFYMILIHLAVGLDLTLNCIYDYAIDNNLAIGLVFTLQILAFAGFFYLYRGMFALTFVYQAGLINIIL